MDLQKLGWDLDRIDLAQDRDRWGGGSCESGNEPPDSI